MALDLRTAAALHGVREQMFPSPEEAVAAASAPTGFSSYHFDATVPLGTEAFQDWAVVLFKRMAILDEMLTA